MVNIPLAEFPNAPAYPIDSALIQAPAPNFNFADLTAEVDGLMQAQISDDALRTYGRGLNQLAQGISSLGDLPDNVAMHLLEIKNSSDLTTVENDLSDATDRQIATLKTTPVTELSTVFQTQMQEEKEKLAARPLSPVAREKANRLFSSYVSRGESRIRTAMSLAGIEDTKAQFLKAVDRDFASHDFERGDSRIQEMVRLGLLTTDGGQALSKRKYTEADLAIEKQALDSDPFFVRDDIAQTRKTGHSEILRQQPSKRELANLEAEANKRIHAIQYGTVKEITLAQRNETVTEEDIRKRAAAVRLSEENTDRLVHGLNRVEPNEKPEIIAYFRENQLSARASVAAYNPANDPTQKKLFALIGDINERVPTSERPALLDELFKRRETGSITPGDSVRAELLGQIRSMHERGFWNRSTSKARESASEAASLAMDAAEKFLKATPDATQADADKWVHAQFRPLIVKRHATILSAN